MVRNSFDKDMEALHLDMIRMGGLIETAIAKSIEALQTKNAELAAEVVREDRQVDDMEKTIESRCLRLLMRQQPVARDLRAISTALKMITDMERIGDQAADIADIGMRFQNREFVAMVKHIPQMAALASEMVTESIDAFVGYNLEQANKTMKKDDEVDRLFSEVKKDLIEILNQEKQPDAENADQAIDIMMIAKYLERIADHAVNICEWVVFFVTGEHKNKKIL